MSNKMQFQTPDLTAANIAKLNELFPNLISEGKVNLDALRSFVGEEVWTNEAYEFTWVGKRDAIAEAGRPIRKTLRPCKAESRDWDTTENLYIEGDNLDVLKLLQESYLGKVKMIYIDPPYNTGHDFIYNDSFRSDDDEYNEEISLFDESGNKNFRENSDSNPRFHSDWCSMIYPRLVLARNLLRNDGVIFISIDDNEVAQLRKICDEVFGESNFITNFIWHSSTGGGIRAKYVNISHQHILMYAKSLDSLDTLYAPLSDEAISMYKDKNEKGLYRDKDFAWKNAGNNPNQRYEITSPDGEIILPKKGYLLRFIKERFEQELAEGNVTFKQTTTGPFVKPDGSQANWNIYIKKYLGEAEGAPTSVLPRSLVGLNNDGTSDIQNIFGERVFDFPKSIRLLNYILKVGANKDGIILDFFSGSATTAHAVMQLNAEDGGKRKFIMVQLPEVCDAKSEAFKAGYKNICEIGKERIRRAGDKIGKGDKGFRVLKLDETNMNDVYYNALEIAEMDSFTELVENIKPDRTAEDLLYGCLLEWGLPLNQPHTVENIAGFDVQNYNDGDLFACFEKNVTEELVREIANRCKVRQPLTSRVVFRDDSFTSSPQKINLFEIFKLLAPNATVRVI
ncbi:site-specific DNA-methyltransferase [Synergistales bacterium]|nr:site-specific DNA-methyltransferase [Synergistales bacterium]